MAEEPKKFKYKVRLTRMLNIWVEVEAATQDEAEDKAFNEAEGKDKSDPCWIADNDIQLEDATHVLVDGEWEFSRFVPKELGGEGIPAGQGEAI